MAALTPVIGPALLTGASVGLNLLQRSQEIQASETAARQQARSNEAQAALRLNDLRGQQAEDAAKRRAQARARATLASRGTGAATGSGAAILQGLAAETARDSAFSAQDFDLRAENVRLGLDTSNQRDLLRLSEQRRRAQIGTLRDGLSLTRRLDLF